MVRLGTLMDVRDTSGPVRLPDRHRDYPQALPLFLLVSGPAIGLGLLGILSLRRAWQLVRWLAQPAVRLKGSEVGSGVIPDPSFLLFRLFCSAPTRRKRTISSL
jgi:hypothetical protein